MTIEKRSKTVVILGMHRTGTSMIGGTLSRLGVDMGEELVGVDWTNPLGHYEDKCFLSLNREILEAAGGDWKNPPDQRRIIIQEENFSGDIRELIRKRESRSKIWGWKDPRTSLTIELYLPHLTNPYLIVCHRDKQEIAESLKRRNKMEIEEGKILAKDYEQRIENFFNDHVYLPRLDLNYRKVTVDPKRWIMEMIDFLELESNDLNIEETVSFIKPNEEVKRKRPVAAAKRMLGLIKLGITNPWKIPGYLLRKIELK